MNDYIDIGLNLAHDSFDNDREQVMADARTAGVSRMIVTGTSVTGSARAAELSLSCPDILYATAGVHPHHAADLDAHSVAALEKLLDNPGVVAIGECGLDYFRDYAPRDAQLKAFEAQLELAADCGLPVFLHQRDAHDDMLRLLTRHRHRISGGVTHCFTGSAEQMAAYLDLDLYVGITGWVCDERRGHDLRDAVPGLPLNRVLLETDAPYLLPRDLPEKPAGRRNEPRYLPHIAGRVAQLMDLPLAELAAAAVSNTETLFGFGRAQGT